MTLPFKPMLSASLDGVDLATLRYPLLGSPKLDGYRGLVWEGVAYSRNAKPLRNRFVQAWAKDKHNLDGEFIVGSPFNDDTGEPLGRAARVNAFDGEPDFKFYLFDSPEGDGGFLSRYQHVAQEMWREDRIEVVPQNVILGYEEILTWEEHYLREGYEGLMLRSTLSPYKHGRSTLREGYLMKLKRFQDGEAVVADLEEGSTNTNELQRDELGRAKRTTHREGLVGNGMVGTIIAVDPKWGELRIAPGTMTHDLRRLWWEFPSELIGKTIHWRSFGYGAKDKPRFPRFYGIREDV